MSAPSRPARSSSDRLVPKPPHRSAVAASVDPPPSPPPCGIRLSIVVAARGPARSSARATRFVPSVGTPSANGPIAVSAGRPGIARLERQQVVQFEADHLGIDEVVAVVAHAGDVQRQRQLGVGPPRAHAVPAAAPRRRRRAGTRRRRRAPRAALSGATPAAANCSAVTMPSSDRRSILRRWPNPARTSGNSGRRVGRRADRAASISTSDDSTFGRGTNTDAGTLPDDAPPWPSTPPSRSPRRTPACAGSAHESFGRLPLHHHDHPVDLRARRRAGRRRAAWPRCRAGWRRAPTRGRRRRVEQGRSSRPPSRRLRPRSTLARSATTSRRSGTMPRSTSMAVTSAPVSASASVSDPSPAPISTTWSPGPTRARSAMRRTVLGSATKFCPRSRRGARWLDSRSSRIAGRECVTR